ARVPGKTEARHEVVVILVVEILASQIDELQLCGYSRNRGIQCFDTKIFALRAWSPRKLDGASCRIEIRRAVELVEPRQHVFIPHAQIHSETRSQFPVILEEKHVLRLEPPVMRIADRTTYRVRQP